MMLQQQDEFFQCRPRRALEWREASDGRAVLLRPKFGSGTLGRRFSDWLGSKHYRIRLDDVGSAVWKSLDGETTLGDVLINLREEFGARVEPAEDRLSRFVQQMVQARLVEL